MDVGVSFCIVDTEQCALLLRRHVTATLFPRRGEGLSEAAAEFNRGPRL